MTLQTLAHLIAAEIHDHEGDLEIVSSGFLGLVQECDPLIVETTVLMAVELVTKKRKARN